MSDKMDRTLNCPNGCYPRKLDYEQIMDRRGYINVAVVCHVCEMRGPMARLYGKNTEATILAYDAASWRWNDLARVEDVIRAREECKQAGREEATECED